MSSEVTDPTESVTQADREAAITTGPIYDVYRDHGISRIQAGKLDDDPLVQAFARHRLAAEQAATARTEARVMALEEAGSKIANLLDQVRPRNSYDPSHQCTWALRDWHKAIAFAQAAGDAL